MYRYISTMQTSEEFLGKKVQKVPSAGYVRLYIFSVRSQYCVHSLI